MKPINRPNRGKSNIGFPKHRAAKPTKERRRGIQLVTSIVLFLVVFIGRDSYFRQVDHWADVIGTDTDFSQVLRDLKETFGKRIDIGQAWKELGGSLLPEETPSLQPDHTENTRQDSSVMPLKDTGRFGLDYAKQFGITVSMPDKINRSEPTPSTEPATVTAVAQVYGINGEKLPSNVSFLEYDLGLKNTVIPVAGEVTSGFGYRLSPITGKQEFHLALDIAAAKGTPILAFSDGTVRYIGESDEFGLYLMIDHDNQVSTFYAHCSKLMVRKGDKVTCGQVIALVGNTGNVTGSHLHLTVLKDGIRLDPAYYVGE